MRGGVQALCFPPCVCGVNGSTVAFQAKGAGSTPARHSKRKLVRMMFNGLACDLAKVVVRVRIPLRTQQQQKSWKTNRASVPALIRSQRALERGWGACPPSSAMGVYANWLKQLGCKPSTLETLGVQIPGHPPHIERNTR